MGFAPAGANFGYQVLLPNGSVVPLEQDTYLVANVTDSVFVGNAARQPADGQPDGCLEINSLGCGLGGAVFSAFGPAVKSSIVVTRSVFLNNSADNGGGAVVAAGLAVYDSTFDGNVARSVALVSEQAFGGGAILVEGLPSTLVAFSNVSFSRNSAPFGAGGGVSLSFFAQAGGPYPLAIFSDVSFVSNSAGGSGGGLAASGVGISVTGGFVCSNNTAARGDGGCAALTSLPPGGASISGGALFDSNSAPAGAGGGVSCDASAPVALSAATFSHNAALAGGAAALVPPSPSSPVFPITATGGCIFDSNSAAFGGAFAVPFLSPSSLRLLNVSSLSGNAASVSGGAVFAAAAPPSAPAPASLACAGACAGVAPAPPSPAPVPPPPNAAPDGPVLGLPAASFSPSPAAASARPGATLQPIALAVADAAGSPLASVPSLVFTASLLRVSFSNGSASSIPPFPGFALTGSLVASAVSGAAVFNRLSLAAPLGTAVTLGFAPSGQPPASYGAYALVPTPPASPAPVSYSALAATAFVTLSVAPCAARVEAFSGGGGARAGTCVCASGASYTAAQLAAAANDTSGTTSGCAACPPGSVAPEGSTSGCTLCDVGLYPSPGGGACTACPPGSSTPAPGAASVASCACLGGYTRASGANGSAFACELAPKRPPLSAAQDGGIAAGCAVFALLALCCVGAYARRVRAAADARAKGWRAFVASQDDIELGPKLGSGGSATVYSATWRGTHVAVKVFDRGLGRSNSASSSAPPPAAPSAKDSAAAAAFPAAAAAAVGSGSTAALGSFGAPPRARLFALSLRSSSGGTSRPRSDTLREISSRGGRHAPHAAGGGGKGGELSASTDPSFAREVEFLSALRHPNILACYAVVMGPQPWLIMECVATNLFCDRFAADAPSRFPGWARRARCGACCSAPRWRRCRG